MSDIVKGICNGTFKIAFFSVKANKTKARHSIFAEGWCTLGSAVASVGSQMKEALEADLSNSVELHEPSDKEETEDQDDAYVLKNNFNISATFRQHKSQCRIAFKGKRKP
ncbi:hypothetical protein MFLAVUS_002870 [Mucor flavus]|uniref:Uncharacterized protein n=1 Tax=Mucor flavus TaxID=439312 RepID=A0ABP9YRJ3_9FUNG